MAETKEWFSSLDALHVLLGILQGQLERPEEMSEPQIHSHYTDELPFDHVLAFNHVECDRCGVLVHAGNNECMQTWIELPDTRGNYCLPCFAQIDQGIAAWSETPPPQTKS